MTDEDSSKDLLNIPAEYATRVFVNAMGTLTISQRPDALKDPEVIVLTKAQAVDVAKSLIDWVGGN